jgi:glycosyltransferase involved in cell wall biosynthesis
MPFLTVGGAEAITSRICQKLRALGTRVVVVTTVETLPEQGDTASWFEGAIEALYQLPKLAPPSEWRRYFFALLRRHQIDIVWLVGSSFIYELLPALRRELPRVAVVDLLFNPVGHTANFLKHKAWIDAVVTEHDDMRNWLVQHGADERRVFVIPNGVDLDEYSPASRRDRPSRRRSGCAFVAAFIGRLSEEKGPDLFVEIAARLRHIPEVRFEIAGMGVMLDALQAGLAARGLSDRIAVLGFVPSRDALISCDAVVVCSRLDGRPNVVMESMAMGVPVVASRVGGIPAMAPPGSGALLCEPEDVGGFANALLSLVEDPELYASASAAARAHAEAHFSITQTAAAYLELFERLQLASDRSASAHAALPQEPAAIPQSRPRLSSTLRLAAAFLSPAHAAGNWRTARLLWRLRRVGCKPADAFDVDYYLAMYPDVTGARVSPFYHYVFYGFREGRNPSWHFNTREYLATHQDAARADVNPLLHHLLQRG